MRNHSNILGVLWVFNSESIWLKSALEGKRGVSLTTGETVEKVPKQILR